MMPISYHTQVSRQKLKQQYGKRNRASAKEKDPLLDLDIKIRDALIKGRDKIFKEDWWPRQGSEDEKLLIVFGLSEFTQGIVEEEERFKMTRTWKGWSQGDIDKQTAKVWLDEGKGVLCARFPFKQKAIDEFREKIPRGKKAWNADDKLWEFSVETIDVVVDILTRNFDEVIDLTQATAPSQVVVSGDPLLSLLDKEDINKIYKVLAKRHHPDVGGDPNLMAKINSVFSKCGK